MEYVRAFPDAPLWPHIPVGLVLRGLPPTTTITKQVKFTGFPLEALIGPRRDPGEATWSWAPGGFHDLGSMVKEWFTSAEKDEAMRGGKRGEG